MSTEVRAAEPEDSSWLAKVSRQSFEPRLREYLISAQHGIGRYWQVELSHPHSFPRQSFLVALDQGRRVGFANFSLLGDDGAHLSYVCVVEDARGRGVAQSLLRAFLDAHPVVRYLQLDVFSDNGPARKLYDQLGFESQSTGTWWVVEPDLNGVVPSSSVSLQGLHGLEAWVNAFGFGELTAVNGEHQLRLGRPSSKVLRCYDASLLQMPHVTASILDRLPEVKRLLVVAPGLDPPSSLVGVPRAVNTTLRMSSSRIRTKLGERGSA